MKTPRWPSMDTQTGATTMWLEDSHAHISSFYSSPRPPPLPALPSPLPLSPPFSSMMLVQKPQSIFPISPAHTHRRVPSAPVIVQPTRTPGLLTLSKPPRSSSKAHLPSQQRHAARSATKPTKSTPVARAQLLTPAPEIPDKKPAMPATPSPHPRGRSHAKVVKESAPAPRYILIFMYH
jgi:hypothetical protein